MYMLLLLPWKIELNLWSVVEDLSPVLMQKWMSIFETVKHLTGNLIKVDDARVGKLNLLCVRICQNVETYFTSFFASSVVYMLFIFIYIFCFDCTIKFKSYMFDIETYLQYCSI